MTVILGINAYHGDSAACLVVDGRLLAAAEEERFRRVKHWAGFPREAIAYCLEAAGVDLDRVDHVAVNRNRRANMLRRLWFTLARRPTLTAMREKLENIARVGRVEEALREMPGAAAAAFRVHNIEHHRAHLASAFLVSPFDTAAVVSVDGFGDFVSTKWGYGRGNGIDIHGQVYFPHSLGLFYLALTQYLGFHKYGDEYKVMGLAPYGRPTQMDKMRELVRLRPGGGFELGLEYFVHHTTGLAMRWHEVEPAVGIAYSDRLIELLGPARRSDAPLTDYHRDLAASVQAMYEEAFFHLLNHIQRKTRNPNLCVAGGCGMNSVANGKVFSGSEFRELYVQAAAGDAGGAIGAAYVVWHELLGNPRRFVMDHAYLGPEYDADQIGALLEANRSALAAVPCTVERVDDPQALVRRVAQGIADGRVIGWFQGRMEWGPRALGNRSILADPRRPDMKDILNHKIKRRESFRPFAPSILREAVADWFETDYAAPFMAQVYQIRKERRAQIPAVTHVDGSGRLQTVTRAQNARYYDLIAAFAALTGVPMVLNTSFNENEPVVCRPQEALDCFLRTRMDMLVLGDYVVERRAAPEGVAA